jgi:hypothetical protein
MMKNVTYIYESTSKLLGRDSGINAFVETATRRIDRKELFVLFEERDIIAREAFNLVNVLDRRVGTMASNLARRSGIHSTEILELTLQHTRKMSKQQSVTNKYSIQFLTNTFIETHHKCRIEINFATRVHLRLFDGLVLDFVVVEKG